MVEAVMLLKDLEWKDLKEGEDYDEVRFTHGELHIIVTRWPNMTGREFDIHTNDKSWEYIDAVTAQCVLYELTKETCG
jgi:hypothetical protein